MRIDDSLRLVLQPDDHTIIYHVPINADVFRNYYRLLAYTRANLAAEGVYYQMGAGPRIAAMVLRDKAIADGVTLGELNPDGTGSSVRADALFTELKRLTTVASDRVASDREGAWKPMPIDAAIAAHVLSADEWSEDLNALVFFTCHSALALVNQRQDVMKATASVLSASLTSLPLTAYLASSPTSTATANSAATASSSSASGSPPVNASTTSSTSSSGKARSTTATAIPQ